MPNEHERTPEEIEREARPHDAPSAQEALDEAITKLRYIISLDEER